MDRQSIIDRVKSDMPERRWVHTEGVMATAIALARQYGENPERAELAAIAHDAAKFWPVEQLEKTVRADGLSLDVLDYSKQLWHAPAGAWLARHEFGIEDDEVLNAIRYHTSGRRGMSLMEKVVWLADLIEPGRDFSGVDEIRKLGESSLERAIVAGLDHTISILIMKGKRIFPQTIEARNSLLEELRA